MPTSTCTISAKSCCGGSGRPEASKGRRRQRRPRAIAVRIPGTTANVPALANMQRYHFDLVDHTTVEDKGGQIFADDIVAADVADELALRVYKVRPELRGKGYSILATNAEGNEIVRSPCSKMLLVIRRQCACTADV
jgi:hypothetical protein